ncbi:MAG: alanine--tRNA ligase, partial [Oscillospiraceae bacterium]|nr:alanine--tRNA ligase [Oscillospiraceae bacterium]
SAKVLAIVLEGETSGVIGEGAKGIVVLDKTPFYAEMGGQVADHGKLVMGENVFMVTDVQKDKGGKYLHPGEMAAGSLSVGDDVRADIDNSRRKAIMRAHSATHLLQTALREVLGDHVHQAGSLVEPDHLRFDFTHFSALTPDEIHAINKYVGEMSLDGMDITIREMSIDEAKKLGATALFGEKYGDSVRVVTMGDKSMELCGGTHLDNTAKIGPFHIVSEGSVASGVRRIEAVTGNAFMRLVDEKNRMLREASEYLKTTPADLINKVADAVNEMKELRQNVENLKDKLMGGEVERFLIAAKNVGDMHIITSTRPDLESGDLRKLGDFLRDKDPNVVAVFATVKEGKITFLASCGKNAVAAGIKAGDIIKNVCAICGGKGGGKPDSAMGGGSEVLKIDDALASVDNFVAEKLG